jgi:hypothetical protein
MPKITNSMYPQYSGKPITPADHGAPIIISNTPADSIEIWCSCGEWMEAVSFYEDKPPQEMREILRAKHQEHAAMAVRGERT